MRIFNCVCRALDLRLQASIPERIVASGDRDFDRRGTKTIKTPDARDGSEMSTRPKDICLQNFPLALLMVARL